MARAQAKKEKIQRRNRKEGQKEYNSNFDVLTQKTQACLNNLCQNFMDQTKVMKGGKEVSLEKIKKIKIVDVDENNQPKTFNFKNSTELANHLKTISANTDLSLSEKINRITGILMQTHNKIMELPGQGNFFFRKSKTADVTRNVLKTFAAEMRNIANDLQDNWGHTETDRLKKDIRCIAVNNPPDRNKAGKTDHKKIQMAGINAIMHTLDKPKWAQAVTKERGERKMEVIARPKRGT
jgi:hypothetical protein